MIIMYKYLGKVVCPKCSRVGQMLEDLDDTGLPKHLVDIVCINCSFRKTISLKELKDLKELSKVNKKITSK